MSGTQAHPAASPLLPLPGFLPDAVSYAARLALAMLAAYYVSFFIQLDSASSAGVCVAIVMQPVPGMAISKAFYRTAGTVAGGAAALVIDGLFPQDRTMLLLAVAVWLGACTFAASLLRDFRAYGAVLAGYTAAVISVGQIDAPTNVLVATLDRVAAILIGILCVALVNAVFVVDTAHEHLLRELRRHLAEARDTALAVLSTGGRPLRDVSLERAAVLLALRTDAAYASAELADGLRRSRAATAALAALLDMLATSRGLGRALGTEGDAAAPGTRAFLRAVEASIRTGAPPPPVPPGLPPTPLDALLVDRAAALAGAHTRARLAVEATETGMGEGLPSRVRIPSDPDRTGAVLNAVRAMIATGLGGVLCVLGNDAGTTLMLIQLAAFVALLGLQPNPSAAAAAFLPGLPFGAALAGGVAFLLLPRASGFGPFALAVGPAVFAMGLAARQPRLAPYVPAMLIDFTILLSPANVQVFNLATFANLVLQLLLATVLLLLSFRLVLPVNPRRRLVRVADRVAQALRRALRGTGRTEGGHWQPSLAYDRLAQGLLWARLRRPGPHPVVTRLCLLAEAEAAATHAWHGLRDAAAVPDLRQPIRAGEAGLAGAAPDAMDAAARALLVHPAAVAVPGAVLRAASGLHGTAELIRRQGSALRRYGVTGS